MMKTVCALLLVSLAVASAAPQQQGRRLFDAAETTTAKPIVQIKRLINQQNRDGSYTYGFEAEDGSFKIETRDNLGNVKGKYGYIDENNDLKVVEYNAGNGTGFDAQADFLPQPVQPVAPQPLPTHHQESPRSAPRPRPQQQARPQPPPQNSFRPEPPRQAPAPAPVQGDPSGLSHFNDGVFQFSFPSPGQPAAAAPAGSVSSDGQYIPSIALEGFSEDRDKDGFVDAIPANHVIVRDNRPVSAPHRGGPAPNAAFGGPSFASVDFRGIPEAAPQARPQFLQQPEAPRFLPQPQPQQQPQRFFDPSAQQQQFQPLPPHFQAPQQPQQFLPPQQPSPARFLQGASPAGGVPFFQGATEPPRFVNPLQLQQGRRF